MCGGVFEKYVVEPFQVFSDIFRATGPRKLYTLSIAPFKTHLTRKDFYWYVKINTRRYANYMEICIK